MRDSEHEPNSVKLKHLAGRRQNVAFFDRRNLVPILGYQLGFKHKTALYDQMTTFAAGDNVPHDICYDPDRNRIWIVCNTNPPRVLRMNPETFTYDQLILADVLDNGYRVAYDGKWIWVTTSSYPNRAWVARINPDTFTYDFLALPDDGQHFAAVALAVGHGYVWVGVGTVAPAPWAAYLLRFERDTTPLTYTEVDLRPIVVPPYWADIREIVYDGTRIWCAGGASSPVAWVDPDTMIVTQAITEMFDAGVDIDIFSGCFDGSYLWWGSEDGRIAKMNPNTYAYDTMQLELATGLIHRMCFDGKYIHAVSYTDGTYYIIHPETMEYVIHELVDVGLHAACFDGLYFWTCDALVSPGTAYRLLPHEPSRRVEHGQTATFSTAAVANITIAVTFLLPFTRVPTVVVSVNERTDVTAEIVSVEACTITVNGFSARCRVTVAGAGGTTARFGWIAISRSTHHP